LESLGLVACGGVGGLLSAAAAGDLAEVSVAAWPLSVRWIGGFRRPGNIDERP